MLSDCLLLQTEYLACLIPLMQFGGFIPPCPPATFLLEFAVLTVFYYFSISRRGSAVPPFSGHVP